VFVSRRVYGAAAALCIPGGGRPPRRTGPPLCSACTCLVFRSPGGLRRAAPPLPPLAHSHRPAAPTHTHRAPWLSRERPPFETRGCSCCIELDVSTLDTCGVRTATSCGRPQC
jgi:hypothetical protein